MNIKQRKIERLKAEMEVILLEFFIKELTKIDRVLHCDNMYKFYGADGIKGFIGFVDYSTCFKIDLNRIKSTLSHDLGCVIEAYECDQNNTTCICLPKTSSYIEYYDAEELIQNK